MCAVHRLEPAALRRRCDPAEIPFETTAGAEDLSEMLGQERAVEAVEFGIAIRSEGFHLFALGPSGTGKQTLVRQFLERQAAGEERPPDWCYVHNFSDPLKPTALRLPAGAAAGLRAAMDRLVAELRVALRAAFESEELRTRKLHLRRALHERQERAFASLQESARKRDVAVARNENGVLIAALHDGEVIEAEAFRQLPEAERKRLEAEMARVQQELATMFAQLRDAEREHGKRVQAIDREMAESVTRRLVDEVRDQFRALEQVLGYLDRVEADVVEHADEFLAASGEGLQATLAAALRKGGDDGSSFRRYRVNVLVDHGGTVGAPVVFEDHPVFPALVGQVGHRAEFGTLVTDFGLIQPGALHRANGGYLLLDALRVLQQPLAWDALKRTLRSGEIRIESLARQLGLAATVSLEPEPIPIERLKVVLVGERYLYYLLAAVDPDLLELFKVVADFEDSVEWDPEVQSRYARLLATIARKEGLKPLDRGAVAALLEEASRLSEDAERLSVRMRPVADLVREADFRAGRAGRTVTTRSDVLAAVEAQRRRGGRLRERVLERIRRGTLLVETRGSSVGQVNGLVVMILGEVAFGHPTRISARVRVGKGELVDIEREVELGGPIHSKGVFILSGYLGQRYAPRLPLALSASLVFEQSYGPVEGDSASLGELCALLSALAEVPVLQSLAITGSVSQSGRVQPIGGVNEKVEGFFDACAEQGFEAGQGVLVPASNVQHLMLRADVVEAVAAGRFAVIAVESVDDAIEALTGRPAGERGADGAFPPGTVNRLVEDRLTALAEDARAFGEKAVET